MPFNPCRIWALLLVGCLCFTAKYSHANPLSQGQLQRIGEKIYQNETGGNPDYLIAWNDGEAFASLGIGHFIWFPEGLNSPFTESFPQLLAYLQEQGETLPTWLSPLKACPWQSKDAFIAAKNTPTMTELRDLLQRTFHLQVAFIQERKRQALPKMLDSLTSDADKAFVSQHFNALNQSALGAYALIDYVNFKGEGTSLKERYAGQGWGLLQVLQTMNTASHDNLNQAFAAACSAVLTRRVINSPQQTVEQRWLPGWKKRCNTYATPF